MPVRIVQSVSVSLTLPKGSNICHFMRIVVKPLHLSVFGVNYTNEHDYEIISFGKISPKRVQVTSYFANPFIRGYICEV